MPSWNPIQAFRAMRKVLQDPEQTDQVFRVLGALGKPAMRKNLQRFRKTDVGQKVLEHRIDLMSTLTDRDYLKSLPSNSLGNVYLNFTQSENISADGLEQASKEAGIQIDSQDFDLFIRRSRCSHDLFHVLTRYGRDSFGELCLLAFTYSQTKNPAFPFIISMAMFRVWLNLGWEGMGAVWQAYRDGKSAGWLLGADWEELLVQPIEQVREKFEIAEPSRYGSIMATAVQSPA